jgi:hypothetical protein
MLLWPIPAPLQPPSIYNVTDEIDCVGVNRAEEVQKQLTLTALCPEVDVGNKKRSIAMYGISHAKPS